MARNRKSVVFYDLRKYQVGDSLPGVLDRLGFSEAQTQLDDWGLFTREGGEFAARYRGNQFFLAGTDSDPRPNLEVVGRVLDKPLLARIVTGEFAPSRVLPFLPFAAGATGIYMDVRASQHGLEPQVCRTVGEYVESLPITRDISEYLRFGAGGPSEPVSAGFNAIFLGGAALGSLIYFGGLAASSLVNGHYARKLTPEAEHYLYGRKAESRLGAEYRFMGIRDGETSLDQHLAGMGLSPQLYRK